MFHPVHGLVFLSLPVVMLLEYLNAGVHPTADKLPFPFRTQHVRNRSTAYGMARFRHIAFVSVVCSSLLGTVAFTNTRTEWTCPFVH